MDVHHTPCDFEIHCPNPECTRNTVKWFEQIPDLNDKEKFMISLEPFSIPGISDYWEGMPISAFTADAQVYSHCPSVLIATVDKFARLPFEPRASAILGNVNTFDDTWGYGRDVAPPDSGEAKGGSVVKVNGFSPPDLIIQDELHLILGRADITEQAKVVTKSQGTCVLWVQISIQEALLTVLTT